MTTINKIILPPITMRGAIEETKTSEAACGSALNALRLRRKLEKEGREVSTPVSLSTSSSPLMLMTEPSSRASPCSNPRTLSLSPVIFEEEPRIPKLKFALIDDSSESICAKVASRHLMSDEEAALWFLASPKISLPPRLGIIKRLVDFKRIEGPLGFKVSYLFSEIEKKHAFSRYASTSSNLISACLFERKAYLGSLLDLLAKAIDESQIYTDYLNRRPGFSIEMTEDKLEFIEYFKTLIDLHAQVFILFKAINPSKKLIEDITLKTQIKVEAYSRDLALDIKAILTRDVVLTKRALQKLYPEDPDLTALSESALMAAAGGKDKLEHLIDLVVGETTRLIYSQERFDAKEIEFLSFVFNMVNQARGLSKKYCCDPYDLEFLKQTARKVRHAVALKPSVKPALLTGLQMLSMRPSTLDA